MNHNLFLGCFTQKYAWSIRSCILIYVLPAQEGIYPQKLHETSILINYPAYAGRHMGKIEKTSPVKI